MSDSYAAPESFTVKRLRGEPAILQAILALEKRNFSKADSWTDILHREALRKNTTILYAESAEKVVGYIVFTTTKLAVHMSKVAVEKPFRRRGIARQLIKACLHQAKAERGVMCATLHVDPQNTAACALYKSMGFEVNAHLEDYYRLGRPAWKMMLTDWE